MLVYTHIITSRSRYIFKQLFNQLLEQEVELTENIDIFKQSHSPKLVYSFQRVPGELYIQAHPLVFQEGITAIPVDVFIYNHQKALFAGNGDLPYDIFAAAFFLMSRYEEYLPSETDPYGRFKAKNSVAFKHQFLQQPVINHWLEDLKKLLRNKYPALRFKCPQFQGTISFDIDVAYAYKGRSIKRSVLSSSKNLLSLNLKPVQERIKVLTGKLQDPFDTYDYIKETVTTVNVDHLFFFLLKKQLTAYDRNIPPTSAALHQLVRSVAAYSKVGIHPSYYSTENSSYLREEKEMLETMLGHPVRLSRQHYLRFKLPDTYMALLEEGITDDYSMGYAELPGFRAGTCTPFAFYNLLTEKETALIVHPVTYMEGSFLEDMQMNPEECIEEIKQLIHSVKEVNGHFLCIWHNHTLSNYSLFKGWRKPYEETLRLLKEN